MAIILGIDPGANEAKPGGVALWVDDDLVDAIDIPITNKQLDDALLAHAIRELLGDRSPDVVFIERVTKRPGAAFGMDKLFVCYGVLRGLVAAWGWRSERVMPGTWKRATGTPAGGERADKDEAARARASQLMPAHARLWPRKRDAGKATAALIALYGHETIQARAEVARPAAGPRRRPRASRAQQEALL